jgi:RimJ/RimL family protein N-acetyltransferase
MSVGVVRLLQPSEFEVFRGIRLEALREEPAAFASTATEWEKLPDEEWRRRIEAAPVFVAFHDDEPIGIMGLMRQGASKMAHRATIIMVYVRQNLRGTGISSALLDALTNSARQIGIRQLELAVSVENLAAQRFYLRKGFSEIGRIPGGFLHDGKEIDEIMMARRIG